MQGIRPQPSSTVVASAAKPATSENVERCSVTVAGASSSTGAVVTNAKYNRV